VSRDGAVPATPAAQTLSHARGNLARFAAGTPVAMIMKQAGNNWRGRGADISY